MNPAESACVSTRARCFGLITVLALFVWIKAVPSANAQTTRTIAIISVDAGGSSLAVDQLTAAMSSDPKIRLVEREAIKRIVQEQELAAMGLTPAARVKVGRLVGVEVLVLVGKNPIPGPDSLRILICDSVTGARIGQLQIAPSSAPTAWAGEIRNVLARFPHGVHAVVALPDLISQDLRLEYTGLQTGLAELLREVLSSEPGLALIEFDEAKTIGGEHALTGGEIRRIVPLFVEGEYRTASLATNGPRIAITISLKMAHREEMKIMSGQIALSDAGSFMTGTVRQKMLELLKRSPASAFDSREEFARLVRRADQFAEIGGFDRSAALREAALLLRPEANDQRILLAKDYSAANRQIVEAWPNGTQRSPTNLFWTRLVAYRRETWRRSLSHVEYLVRNRQVDIGRATQLADLTIQSLRIRGTEAGQFKEEENLKKEFLRSVRPALLSLPNEKGKPASQDQRVSAANRIYDALFCRMDGNYLAEDDLVLTGDLLCDLLPEHTPLAMKMIYVLGSGSQTFKGSNREVNVDAWLKFIQRLLNSPRPLVNAYGRYAQLCDQRIRLKQFSEEMLAEARSLAAAAKTSPLAQLDPRGDLRLVASDNAVWIEMRLRPQKSDPNPGAPMLKPLIPTAEGTYVSERVRLKPIRLLATSKTAALSESHPRQPNQAVVCDELLKVWEGVDAVLSRRAVVFVKPGLVCEEAFVDPKSNIGSVVFDGQYVWISTGYDRGVYVIDRNGKTIATVGPAEGLPEAYVTMPLHALSPGRVMAAGSIDQARRGWLATIELEQGKPRVKVFHEAIKVARPYADWKQLDVDPATSFPASWIMEHRDETKKQWLFVGRGSLRPLVVNGDTLAVSVYPAGALDRESFPRIEPAFWSHNGLLYVANSRRDFNVFRLDPTTHRFTRASDRAATQWHFGNAIGGSIAEFRGHIYSIGDGRWVRSSISGDGEEVLIASPQSLPHYGSGKAWRIGVLGAAGLVAWSGGELYEFAVEPDQKTSPAN